jgi:hypothetical protein
MLNDVVRFRQSLSERSVRLAIAEEGLLAFAGREVSEAATSGESVEGERPAAEVLERWLRAQRSGDPRRVRRLYAPNASVAFLHAGIRRFAAEGASEVADLVQRLVTRQVRATGPVTGQGEFAAVRYADARSQGVVVLRTVDRKIADQWVVVDER